LFQDGFRQEPGLFFRVDATYILPMREPIDRIS
jgi:hypothetical protein